jgi:hypothetical protein
MSQFGFGIKTGLPAPKTVNEDMAQLAGTIEFIPTGESRDIHAKVYPPHLQDLGKVPDRVSQFLCLAVRGIGRRNMFKQ